MDTTVTLIVLLLIVLTIAFEAIKEHIEESADRNMRPIIASLFGEMTVLGFLSIFTFCVTKLGFFEKISTQLFGEEEEEALLETFEFVHYMLVFVMVFFVVSVLTLVGGAEKTEKTWSTMDKACRDSEYLRVLDDLESNDESRNEEESGWLIYFAKLVLLPSCFRSKSKDYRKSLSLFRGLRSEFVLERSLVAPYTPNATNHVEEDFNYGQYLSICLGHELAHVVHVNLLTWVLFALLTLLLYGVAMAVANRITVSCRCRRQGRKGISPPCFFFYMKDLRLGMGGYGVATGYSGELLRLSHCVPTSKFNCSTVVQFGANQRE
jgi:hypothetical protein